MQLSEIYLKSWDAIIITNYVSSDFVFILFSFVSLTMPKKHSVINMIRIIRETVLSMKDECVVTKTPYWNGSKKPIG